MAGLSAFITALVINSALAVIFTLLFVYLRRKWPLIYEPRCHINIPKRPDPPGNGAWSWLTKVLHTSDDEFFEYAGMDALTVSLYFRYGLKVFSILLPLGLVLLMPVNATAGGGLDDLDKISLSNVEESSYRMVLHLILSYVFSFVAIYYLNETYRHWIKYRLIYLSQASLHHRTIFVQDVPINARSAVALRRKFGTMYHDVQGAVLGFDTTKLEEVTAERDETLRTLEHTTAVIALNPKKKRPVARVDGFLCFGGHKEDAEQAYTHKLQELNHKVANLKQEASNSNEYYAAGFVTFKSMTSASTAAQIVHTHRPLEFQTRSAPEPRDVYWPNLRLEARSRLIRTILVTCFTLALVAFWAIPVAFVSSLTTLEALSRTDGLSWIADVVSVSPVLQGFLEGFLPTLALIIFFAVLPMICLALAKAEGTPAYSWMDISAFKKLYLFFVFNVFFVSLIAGSIFQSISEISDVSSAITLLGQAIPKTGIFFTNYVMILSLSAFPGMLLQIVRLIIVKIKQKWLCKTLREHKEVVNAGPFNYGTKLPVQILVALLGFVYAVVAPLMLPFLVIFYALGYVTYRYNSMYVFVPTYEGGGEIFNAIFNRTMLGIFLHQIVVLAILSVKKFTLSPLMVPLILATAFYWYYCNREYAPVAANLPREDCAEVQSSTDEQDFQQPSLHVPDEVTPEPFTGPVQPIRANDARMSISDERLRLIGNNNSAISIGTDSEQPQPVAV